MPYELKAKLSQDLINKPLTVSNVINHDLLGCVITIQIEEDTDIEKKYLNMWKQFTNNTKGIRFSIIGRDPTVGNLWTQEIDKDAFDGCPYPIKYDAIWISEDEETVITSHFYVGWTNVSRYYDKTEPYIRFSGFGVNQIKNYSVAKRIECNYILDEKMLFIHQEVAATCPDYKWRLAEKKYNLLEDEKKHEEEVNENLKLWLKVIGMFSIGIIGFGVLFVLRYYKFI